MGMPEYQMPNYLGGTPTPPKHDYFMGGMIGFFVLMLVGFAVFIAKISWDQHEWSKQAAFQEQHARYHEGDIVRSKIGRFRGIVEDRFCRPSGCEYEVKFPTATMQPQWVEQYEIEPAQ